MATITITPGWAGPASAVGTNPIVVQVAGVGPTGPAGTSGVAPSGTGIVTVTSGTLGTPGALTGDVTTTAGGLATTLATVNGNVGTFTNATVTVNAKGLVTAASSGAAGGITIGDTVTSGTSGRVLYVGAGPVLAQDAGLTYDPSTDNLTVAGIVKATHYKLGAGGTYPYSSSGYIAWPGGSFLVEETDRMLYLPAGDRFDVLNAAGGAFLMQVNGSLSSSPNRICLLKPTYIGPTAGTNPSTQLDVAGMIGFESIRSVPLTPSQITSNQNNYAPGVARYYRLSTDASRDITGLSCSQVSGQECEIWNVGSNNIVLKHQDANSTAANRFICTGAADITLAQDEIALLRYDSTTSRWRVRKV